MAFLSFSSNVTAVTSEKGTDILSGASGFTPVWSRIRVARSLVFYVVICRSLFVLLSFFLLTIVSFSIYVFWLHFGIFKLLLLYRNIMKICVFRSYKSRHIVSPYVSTNSQKSYPGCFVPTRVDTLYLHMFPPTVRTRTLVVSFLQE